MMARNNSRKAEARRLQAATGESYTSAVRRLTENGGQLDVAVDPTDAQLALEVLSRLGYEDTDITTGWLPYMPGVDVDHRLPLLTVDLGDQPSGLPVSLSHRSSQREPGTSVGHPSRRAVLGLPGRVRGSCVPHHRDLHQLVGGQQTEYREPLSALCDNVTRAK